MMIDAATTGVLAKTLDNAPMPTSNKSATEAAGSAVDLYHFTRQLNDVLDDEGRQRAVKMMWQVVYVDGRANDLESNIIWRIADLLGVSSRQRIELRQLVAAGWTARSSLILAT